MSSAATNPDPINGESNRKDLLCEVGLQSDQSDSVVLDEMQIESDATMRRSAEPSRGRRNDQSCLVQIYPPDVVDGMLLIETEQLIIGRDEKSDLVLSDKSVSRQHAVIRRTDQGYELEDMGSTNGTFVGGQAAKHTLLKAGDTIRFGSFLFRFLSAGSVESQYHETVYSALTRDALTGTMNKRYLLETLTRSLATAVRQKHQLTVVMIDIDHFKAVNDTHGHLVGDEVLREFGQRVGESCRAGDLLARYGGEEFCLLLSGTDGDEAEAVANRCRIAVCEKPFETASGPLDITASFGLACLDVDKDETGLELINRADQQLYEAKRGGRNRVCGA